MRDLLLVGASAGYYNWLLPASALLWIPAFRTRPFWLRWLRIGCAVLMPSWVVVTILAPPTVWWTWPLWALVPFYWRRVHRRFCKDKHGRRLLERARGFVQRRGNRLVVAPVVAK